MAFLRGRPSPSLEPIGTGLATSLPDTGALEFRTLFDRTLASSRAATDGGT